MLLGGNLCFAHLVRRDVVRGEKFQPIATLSCDLSSLAVEETTTSILNLQSRAAGQCEIPYLFGSAEAATNRLVKCRYRHGMRFDRPYRTCRTQHQDVGQHILTSKVGLGDDFTD